MHTLRQGAPGMKKSLHLTFRFKPNQPVFAVGFLNRNEFILSLYPFVLQIRLGY